jgi:hypothetical protein
MKFEYSNNIKCTKEEAWELITDLERRPEWIHFMEKCYYTDKKEGIVGSKYQEKEVFLGIPININYDVIVYEEYKQFSSRCTMAPFYPVVNIYVNELPNKMIFSKLEFDIKLGPFEWMPKFMIKKQVDALVQPLVDAFKDILERGTSLK